MSEIRPQEYSVDDNGNMLSATYSDKRFTISYSRKVNLGNYESAEVFVSTQILVPQDAPADEQSSAIRDGFIMVRASACEQLGIQFAVDEQSILQERIERHFGPVEVVTGVEATGYNKPAAPTPPTSGRSDAEAPRSKRGLWEELEAYPERWYDNRLNKKNPKGPDFKRKQTGEGLWIEYQGKSAVPSGITLPSL